MASIAESQLLLGQIALDRGAYADAFEWFEIASRANDARAFNMLGRCFERGWGVSPDAHRAAQYYQHAADLGDAWAMFNLADLFAKGEGVPLSEIRAFDLYRAAAELGHVKSLNMLGLFYEEGSVVASEREEARRLFQAGAEGGDCWAQFNYARLFLEDGAVEAALFWFEETFKTGFPAFWTLLSEALSVNREPRLKALAEKAASLSGAKNSGEVRAMS